MEDYFIYKNIADLSAYITWSLVSWLRMRSVYYKTYFAKYTTSVYDKIADRKSYIYYILVWAFAMAIVSSTFDMWTMNPNQWLVLSKSIVWWLFGWIVVAEIYKYIHGISWSTWFRMLPWLVSGLIIGRIWAFLIGLRDHTHGIETTLPWWWDYGDGILRHPTQLYEVGILLLFWILISVIWWYAISHKHKSLLQSLHDTWFYWFILVYSLYRFCIDFLKPYGDRRWWLNTYQVLALLMIAYSVCMLYRKYKKI